MPETLPRPVALLLEAPDETTRQRAWSAFLQKYSRLLLGTARRASAHHDETMDRYTFILDQLREDDCRRLRAFSVSGAGKFTTWLVVVARRICVDRHRQVYGRPQANGEPGARPSAEREARRNLARLVGEQFDIDRYEDQQSPNPEAGLLASEQRHLLENAVSVLDMEDQLLLTLRFEDGHSTARIAQMTNAPSRFHVHRRLKKVLGVLREALEARGMSEP